MKFYRIIMSLVIVMMASSCVNGTTTIGNPPAPLPTPTDGFDGDGGDDGGVLVDPAGFTNNVLNLHSIWKDEYYAEFITEDGTVNVYPPDAYEKITFEYIVKPDGSIVTGDSDKALSLIGFLDYNSAGVASLTIKLLSESTDVVANLVYTDSEEDVAYLDAINKYLSADDADPEKAFQDNIDLIQGSKPPAPSPLIKPF